MLKSQSLWRLDSTGRFVVEGWLPCSATRSIPPVESRPVGGWWADGMMSWSWWILEDWLEVGWWRGAWRQPEWTEGRETVIFEWDSMFFQTERCTYLTPNQDHPPTLTKLFVCLNHCVVTWQMGPSTRCLVIEVRDPLGRWELFPKALVVKDIVTAEHITFTCGVVRISNLHPCETTKHTWPTLTMCCCLFAPL